MIADLDRRGAGEPLPDPADRRAGLRYLWLIGGFVALILGANTAMVVFAMTSWRGLETDEPYIQGLNYNQELDRRARQEALDWRMHVAAAPTGPSSLHLAVTPVDGQGAPLAGAVITGVLMRPTQDGLDLPIRLQPAGVRPGERYEADVDLPLPGVWDLTLRVARGGDVLEHQQRVFLSP